MDSQKQLVLFVVDGMRPDAMTAAGTPVIDSLLARGLHTLTARTVMPSMTLPCHMSLFHGVRPSRHGITSNIWTPQVRPVPGLFETLNGAGLACASFYNWEELRDLSRPDALQASFMIRDTTLDGRADAEVARLAAAWLAGNPFNFAFVYMVGTDHAGHLRGWMSDPYLEAIAHADRCIGQVLRVLPADCAILLASDHGGHEQMHGTDSREDMTIPLIIAAPSIGEPGRIESAVEITDIAPTITAYFGLQAPAEWIGAPIPF